MKTNSFIFILTLGLVLGALGVSYYRAPAFSSTPASSAPLTDDNQDSFAGQMPAVEPPPAPATSPLIVNEAPSAPVISSPPVPPPVQPSSLRDDFAGDRVIEEAPWADASSDPAWWVDSGGMLVVKDGYGATIHGDLPAYAYWRLAYKKSNPEDTDNGFHPQNIFRLVTRMSWHNIRQEVYFQISNDTMSASRHRYVSNGVFLLNRYQDGNNLYYVGVRVDGAAIIKKKYRGTYYNMATKSVFSGSYNRDTNPNLLPKHTWIGLRSEVTTRSDGTAAVALFLDRTGNGNWTEVLTAHDDGVTFGGPAITKAGRAGIRTDFMDVQFDRYRAEERI